MKKINTAIIAFVLFAIACSKDRTMLLGDGNPTPEKPNSGFAAISKEAFDKLGAQPERKTIKNQDDLPFVGSQGTKVWLFDRDLRMPDGSIVSYPFEIELLELLTPKDMILHLMPTVSRGRLLTTGGQVNIRAYKDGKELKMTQFNNTQIIVPAQGRVDGLMDLFYGEETKDDIVDWIESDTSSVQGQKPRNIYGNDGAYFLFPNRLGWLNIDKFYEFTEAKTQIGFSSENPPLDKIVIFLYFPDLKSLMQVYGEFSGEVPVGRTVKIIAMSISDDEKEEDRVYHSFFQDLVVADKQKVEIKLAPTTKESLLSYLESL